MLENINSKGGARGDKIKDLRLCYSSCLVRREEEGGFYLKAKREEKETSKKYDR